MLTINNLNHLTHFKRSFSVAVPVSFYFVLFRGGLIISLGFMEENMKISKNNAIFIFLGICAQMLALI